MAIKDTYEIYLDGENYRFSNFGEKIGQSGQLILATHKTNPHDKWVVKHEVVSDVFAEFFYSRISNDLGYAVPECRLGDYNGKIAVYIKHIENLKRIILTDYIDDIYKRLFLMSLFGNDDREEFYTDQSGKI